MGRRYDNAPVGNTCPLIDNVISLISNIQGCSSEDEVNYAKSESNNANHLLEEIRSANDSLRTWGNDLCNEKEYFEKELDEANSRNEDLKSDIEQLKTEIEDLYQQLKELA